MSNSFDAPSKSPEDEFGAFIGHSIDHTPVERTASDGSKYRQWYEVVANYEKSKFKFVVHQTVKDKWDALPDDERGAAVDAYVRANKDSLRQ